MHYEFQPAIAGYLKSTGEGLEGPPIIFVSRRKVKKGEMTAYGSGMQAVADWWYSKAPGLLAGTAYVSEEDPDAVWDLRVMSNWEKGFIAHVQPDVFQFIGPWVGHVDSSKVFEDARCFSPDGKALVAANPGNGMYTHYEWNDGGLLGPMPNFGKSSRSVRYS